MLNESSNFHHNTVAHLNCLPEFQIFGPEQPPHFQISFVLTHLPPAQATAHLGMRASIWKEWFCWEAV